MEPRPALHDARRVVVKLGTGVVVEPDGRVATERLRAIVADCAALRARGVEVLVVTSGAVGLGRRTLGAPRDDSLRAKQAYAAVGQAQLIEVYRELFEVHGQQVAQVLLTSDNFVRREQFLSTRDTLEALLAMGVVPLINENDTVSTEELAVGRGQSFGDNDGLSALVAAKTSAAVLTILTDVDGIYERNPAVDPAARRIPVITDIGAFASIDSEGTSAMGRGGMRSKLEAARIASICGVTTWITRGAAERPLLRLLDAAESDRGTVVLPGARLAQKKQWIAFSSGYRGTVTVNDGAARALLERRGSLLPVGIVRVDGAFGRGDTVRVQNERGVELGRGMAELASTELRRVVGKRSETVERELGSGEVRFVHRNHMVIFGGSHG